MSRSVLSFLTARVAFWLVLACAAVLRFWQLDTIPPGLWYDEALYCLNALSIRWGYFPIFFMLDDHPVEPLYVYTLAIAFGLFGKEVIVARAVSALWGTLAVALCYPLARRFFSPRWAIAACWVYSVFRWPLHFSRTIFRAVTPPVFIMLVVIFFLRWRDQRKLRDALLCGLFLGLGLYTYISFRLVPLMWLGWVGWLLYRQELVWHRDWKHLAVIVATAFVVSLPLVADFVIHPEHFRGRIDEVSMFHDQIIKRSPDGSEQKELIAKPLSKIVTGLAENALAVARMWTFKGDHVGRHNLPYEPVFDWISGVIFYLGVAVSLYYAARCEWAFLPLWWLAVLACASVFSFGAPNILRMQGAIPAVVLLYVTGLRLIYKKVSLVSSARIAQVLAVCALAWFGLWQLDSYFRRFAQSPAVRNEFLTDTFYEPARAARLLAPEVQHLWVSQDLANHLTFRFVTCDVPNIRAFTSLMDIPTTTPRPAAVLISMAAWQEDVRKAVDPAGTLQKLDARLLREFSLLLPISQNQDEWNRAPWARLWILPAKHPERSALTKEGK